MEEVLALLDQLFRHRKMDSSRIVFGYDGAVWSHSTGSEE